MGKLLSVLLAFCIISVPVFSNLFTVSGAQNVDENHVNARITELTEKLNNKCFTVNQSKCTHSIYNSCSNCYNVNVFKAEWFKNIFGNVNIDNMCGVCNLYPRAYTCAGFANFAFWYIHSNSNSDTVSKTNIVKDIAFSKENIRKYAITGDAIQVWKKVGDNYYQHYFIYVSGDDSGIYILDGNGAKAFTVEYRKISYSEYTDRKMTISRATNRTITQDSVSNITETTADGWTTVVLSPTDGKTVETKTQYGYYHYTMKWGDGSYGAYPINMTEMKQCYPQYSLSNENYHEIWLDDKLTFEGNLSYYNKSTSTTKQFPSYTNVHCDESISSMNRLYDLGTRTLYRYVETAHTDHNYTEGYDTDHPHKIYMKCVCGDHYYTNKTKTVSSCKTCNPMKTYYIDLNAMVDGKFKTNLLGVAKATMYINGQKRDFSGGSSGIVVDYYTKHEPGTTYELKDIVPENGYEFIGMENGTLKGVVGDKDVEICLKFVTKHTHSYTETGFDNTHPHKVWNACSCGEKQYTETTKKIGSCTICYPPHNHSFTTNIEDAHPHKEYRICSCGEKQYTGVTKTVDNCTTCYPPQPHIVTYNSNGGIEPPSPVSVESGKSVVLSSEILSRNGYTFLGWSQNSSALQPAYMPGESFVPTENITLYAVWQKKEATVEIILTIDSNTAIVSGAPVYNDVAPIIENERTMLPARFVAEKLGATVRWDDVARKVIIIGSNNTIIELFVDSDKAYVNGDIKTLDSPAFIRNSRTYTPVRFICEALGADVSWNPEARKVTITK